MSLFQITVHLSPMLLPASRMMAQCISGKGRTSGKEFWWFRSICTYEESRTRMKEVGLDVRHWKDDGY